MSVVVCRIFCTAILALCVLGAGANVAQAAARLDHSCCDRAASADSMSAPDAPCDGFLPLTCCHAAALPGGEHASMQTPAEFALAVITTIAATPRTAITRHDDAALAPRIAATRLTVVRQL
jgi:hypothetical protein